MTADTALIIIDVQIGMFEITPPLHKGAELLAAIRRLILRASAGGIPVIYIQHDGRSENHPLRPDKPGWPIHPDIRPEPGEPVIRKRTPDSFFETGLQDELSTRGVRKLVVAGIQTEYCVDTTCRAACSRGYDVTLAQDAHSTWDTETLQAVQIIAHHNTVLGNWFVTLKNVDEINFAEE